MPSWSRVTRGGVWVLEQLQCDPLAETLIVDVAEPHAAVHLIALLENGQQADGSVVLPDALREAGAPAQIGGQA